MVETTFMEHSWNETTPLLVACLNGFLDIAAFLIEKCNVDVDEGGSLTIDKEKHEDVSPLWCAACAGHLNIVKLLVRCGVSINKTTKTKSTPLRAACFEGYFEIVEFLIEHGADIEIANRYGYTTLMIACYKSHFEICKYLVGKGAAVNRKDNYGTTALHHAVTSGNLDIIKLLIKHGAKNDGDSSKITPLLVAAIKANESVVEFLIEAFDCTKEEKVNALELLGATFMNEKLNMSMALKYWRQAMQLRYENNECPLEKTIAQSHLAEYLNETEAHTLSEIEELKSDPDKMEIQALLVRERILGIDHVDTLHFIKLRGARHADEKDYRTYLKLYVFALCWEQKLQKPFSRETHITLSDMSELCCLMLNDSSYAKMFHIYFSDILQVFEIALKEIEIATELSQNQGQDLCSGPQFFHTVICAIHLVSFMHKMQPHLTETQNLELKKAVSQLIQINPRFSNGSLVKFLTCFKRPGFVTHPMVPFPSSEMIDLLLKIGGF